MNPVLTNAPLILTLAQVRFNPLPKLGDVIADIREEMRREYPDQSEVQQLEVRPPLSPGQPPVFVPHPAYQFGNIERTHRFELLENSLTLVSTAYPGYDAFAPMFMSALEVVHRRVQLQMFERLGLRYCDRVIPKEGDSLDAYLKPEVLGLATQVGGALQQSYSEVLVRTPEGVNLLSRALFSNGLLLLPPGIEQGRLVLPARLAQYRGPSVLLDNDGFIDVRTAFDITQVRKGFDVIHDVIGDVFKRVTTEHAQGVWR